MSEEENNPNYNGMVFALQNIQAGFNALTIATYNSFGNAADDVLGLTSSYKFFTEGVDVLPFASVVAAYASSDEDLVLRNTINAAAREGIALSNEFVAKKGIGAITGILTGTSTNLILNSQPDLDFYGYIGTGEFLGLSTSDYHYVKEYQRGETSFYEAYNSAKQELYFTTEGYDTTDFTTLKLNLNHEVSKVIRTNNGNTIEIDLRDKDWKLTWADGTQEEGSLQDNVEMSDAAETLITQMYNNLKEELQLRDPNINLEPLDQTVTNIVTQEGVTVFETPEKWDGSWGGIGNEYNLFYNVTDEVSAFTHDSVTVIKDHVMGNTYINGEDPVTGYMNMISHDAVLGGNVFHYADPNNGGVTTAIIVTDPSLLTADQKTAYYDLLSAGNRILQQGGEALIHAAPDSVGIFSQFFGDNDVSDTLENIAQNAEEKSDVIEGGFGSDIVGVNVSNDSIISNMFDFTTHAYFIQNGTKSEQIDSTLWVYNKIMTDGVVNADGDPELGNAKIVSVPNGFGGNAVKIVVDGVDYSYITKYSAGNFQQQVIETIGADGRTNSAQITLADGLVNQLYRGEPIKIKYPDDFVFGFAGGYVGNIIGQQLANGELAHDIISSAITRTLGKNLGEVMDFLATGENTIIEAFFDPVLGVNGTYAPRPNILKDLLSEVQSGVISAISGKIVEELGDAIGIEGVGGEVFDVVGTTVTTGIVNETFGMIFNGMDSGLYTGLLSGSFDFSASYPPNTQGITGTYGDFVQAQAFNALAGYAGNRLAGELISPEDEMAALFGSTGSAIGTAIATGNIAASTAVGQLFASSAILGGPIGIALGAFVGTILGTALGNILGGDDEPEAWARVEYDTIDQKFRLDMFGDKHGGSEEVASSMAKQMIDAVNDVIGLTNGVLRIGENAPRFQIGYKGDKYTVSEFGGHVREFDTPADAVMHGAFIMMKDFDLVGGHAVLMRAWHNSEATNIHKFKEDLEIAEAFQQYLLNPTGVLALMMDQPDSEVAQAWASILQRAAELKLHLPSDKDLDGGWGSALLAQGIDPNLIPDIDGNTITLTDPITGEETVLHHVIGPGYEIVRIEGTDGNDIIDVIVDGSTITYVDAGDGDDIVSGSDEADIIVGGTGDDDLSGLGGNDWIHGGDGADTIDGGAGQDTIIGAADNDVINGGEDDDIIYGSGGDDDLYSGGGTDHIYGGDGNDTFQGSYAHFYGGADNDTFYLSKYNKATGGAGDDVFHFTSGQSYNNKIIIGREDGHDVIHIKDGGYRTINNTNVLQFDNTISINELFFEFSGPGTFLGPTGTYYPDLKISVLGEDQTVTIKNFFRTSGSTNNPSKLAIEAHDGLLQLYGNERVINAIENDKTILKGGYYEDFNLSLSPISGPSGTYNVISDNHMLAGIHDFEIDTNAGEDYSYANHSNVWYRDSNNQNPHTFITIPQNDQHGVAYNTRYNLGGARHDGLDGRDYASNSPKYMYGDSGNDTIYGGYAHDVLVGGLGNDTIHGVGSGDKLYGGHGDDTLYGSNDNDFFSGGAGNDFISGRGGNDTLHGGAGNDTLTDHIGNNTMWGGAGNDTFDVRGADGGTNVMYGEEGNDTFYGGDLARDTLYGGAGDDTLRGASSDDWLSGGEGNDILKGGADDDTLGGGSGDDSLYGGTGNDILEGGIGDDTYIYISGNDKISEIGIGLDTLIFDSIWSPSDVSLDGNLITLSSDDSITFNNIALIEEFSFSGFANMSLAEFYMHVNTVPIAQDDVFSGDQDLDITGNLLVDNGNGADSDPDGDTLSVVAETISTANGSVVISVNGDFTYTPAAGYFGADSFSYTLQDGNGGNTTATANITVNEVIAVDPYIIDFSSATIVDYALASGVGSGADYSVEDDGATLHLSNNIWKAINFSYDVTANTVLEFDFMSNNEGEIHGIGFDNNDTRTSNYTFEVFGTQNWGIGESNTQNYDGNEGQWVHYTIDVGAFYSGTFSHLFFTNDDDANNNSESFFRNVRIYEQEDVNDNPIAQDDVFSGDQDLDITGNLLVDNGNGADSDPDGDTLSVVAETISTANGSVVISVNGDFTYTPAAGYFGADSFSYTLQDGNGGNTTATANLTINADSTINMGDPLNFVEADFVSYTNQDKVNNTFTVTNNTELHMAGNSWKSLNFDYTVTNNTYIQLDYQTVVQGEIQGLVFLEQGLNVNASSTVHINTTIIRLDGYQGISSGQDALYSEPIGTWEIITIKLSDYNAVGTQIDNLVFVNDDDDDKTGEALFRNIKIFEEGTEGADTLNGSAFNEILFGRDGDDILHGQAGDDILYGGAGIDMLYGHSGADTFVFESSTAYAASDNIQDFSLSDNDKLDISDLLNSYDPLTDAISDFVQITENGSNSYISVDADGGADNFVQVAAVFNVTGLTDEEALETSGNLITV
ncbi:MAG: Ig-like domain-containing protein [Alphaproteobacteria bacterium]